MESTLQKGEQISLIQLFTRVETIEIPILQRDYAQGRPEAADVRANFLESLRYALCQHEVARPLDLDFVYGSVYRKGRSILSILDGQQRLTTLFLLHWYLALRDGEQDHFRAVFRDGGRSRFRYATRPSSVEFFDALVNKEINLSAIGSLPHELIEAIIDAGWFFLAWKKDPTVRSCLEMLGAIHYAFRNEPNLYSRLVDEQQPRITFHFLDLPEYGLTDDLYIKMNARGKSLTAFENFKAWLVTRIEASATPDFGRSMDLSWTDFFWRLAKLRLPAQNKMIPHDELFLRFLYLMAFFEACERLDGGFGLKANTEAAEWISLLRDARDYVSLRSFEERDAYTADTIRDISEFLDYFSKTPDDEDLQLLQRCLSGLERHDDLVKLYSVLCFMRAARSAPMDSVHDLRKRWSRVTSNLINNSRLDELATMVPALHGLRSLQSHALVLYEALIPSLKIGGPLATQLEEEINKAELIRADFCWEQVLLRAEKHDYLQGRVGFLLDASRDGNGRPDANRFDAYAAKAAVLLGHKMLHSDEFLLQRALLSLGNYLVSKGGGRYSFCSPHSASYRDRDDNWLKVVSKPVFRQLLDRIDGDVETSLRAIIADSKCDDWRRHVVRNPSLIAYCKGSFLLQERTAADGRGTIYLMSKSRMSGYYCEVHTRALYLTLRDLQADGKLPSDIERVDYKYEYGGETPALIVKQPERTLTIEYDGNWSCSEGEDRCEMPESLLQLLDCADCQEGVALSMSIPAHSRAGVGTLDSVSEREAVI